jgi:leucyl aminopeptidase (aminopeptidase T)
MKKIAKIIIEQCVQPSKKDRILIVSDIVKKHLAEPIFNYCVIRNLNTNLIVMLPTEADGQEPDSIVSEAILTADVIIAITKWSISHTKPMVEIKKKGAKIVSMPAVKESMLKRCIPVDYIEMSKMTKNIADCLTESSEAKIVSENGTDLLLSIKGFKGQSLDGIAEKGKLINLPDGEAAVGISDANGFLVIDGSMPPDQKSKWGVIGKIKEPIELRIKNGKVVDISGKREACFLKKILSAFDESVYKLAELGIGTNPNARLSGNVTEDEKILGTLHIALGDDTSFGGNNSSPLHLDGVMLKPTLKLDGRIVLEDGILKV